MSEAPRAADQVRDQRIERLQPLSSPQDLLDELPLGDARTQTVVAARQQTRAIVHGQDDRLLVIVGPCSVHDPDATLEYADRLSDRAARLRGDLLVTMRVYFEKPRTTIGWKGLINDPHRDGSGDVNEGLRIARRVLLGVLAAGSPAGCEFLDPFIPQYISDAVCWGAIGARTVESQTHRQLGSGLSMPVGFKNRTDGNVQVATDALRAAAVPQAFAGISPEGVPAVLYTRGNPDCHIILRGGSDAPNYGSDEVAAALAVLRAAGLPERVMIDCSHDNSGKDATRQPAVAARVAEQIADGQPRDHWSDAGIVPCRRAPGAGALDRSPTANRSPTLVWIGSARSRSWRNWRGRSGPGDARRGRRRRADRRLGRPGSARAGSEPPWPGMTPPGAALQKALDRGAVDDAAGGLEAACQGAEVVFVAAPVGALPGAVGAALRAASPECVVTDVGSTKRGIVSGADDPRFVGGHPLAGAASSGVQHARADLFEGATWYLTPAATTSGILYERLHRLLRAIGARPAAIDPEAHDVLLAAVSHLPHVLANTLVERATQALAAGPERLPATGPSFRDATRVAGASSGIWTDIYLSNADALAGQIDAAVGRWRASPKRCGGATRTGSPSGTSTPPWSAPAADRGPARGRPVARGPGLGAQPSWRGGPAGARAGRAGVNIVDLALHPAPDMTEGVVALWVSGDGSAQRAAEVVRRLGFPVALA